MPELPEVETRVRQLRAPCINRTIQRARIDWPRHIDTPSPTVFTRRIRGQRVTDVRRRGKFLVFQLSEDALLFHLRMSGDLYLTAEHAPKDRHVHTVLTLDNLQQLRFSDARKFGRVYLVRSADEITAGLGPEPLSKQFTPGRFTRALAARKRMIKPLLLDQNFLAGMGNIYTDEALHLAGLHPLTHSHTVSPVQARRLWRSLRQVLHDGILHNGASIDWVYKGGSHQHHFRVYRRRGEPCQGCGSIIIRTTIAQRGTYFCPGCQPSP
ncbi:MAG: DNA-formamidopyrimidine glycosylase [Anaerolineales bacterium]|nr:DNA-formamidopyrimidine glycosylase [Anaerolineales bacterium]